MSASGHDAEIIARNIELHNEIAGEYESRHGEIFNDFEQVRLRRSIERALSLLGDDRSSIRVMDYGCGSGNLSAHLLDLGLRVVSADIAQGFLDLIETKFGGNGCCETFRLNGRDLHELDDATFDMIAVYSVLHHIPDYLAAVREMVRVIRSGGILYLDHEANDGFWNPSSEYRVFQKEARRWRRKSWWQKLLRKLSFSVADGDKKSSSHEGDIHVYPEDHVEWGAIRSLLVDEGCIIEWEEDFLLFKNKYDPAVYGRYKDRLADYHCLVARKA